MHIVKDGQSLKVWLQSVEVARNKGYTDQEIARLLVIVAKRRDDWMGAWNDFFGI